MKRFLALIFVLQSFVYVQSADYKCGVKWSEKYKVPVEVNEWPWMASLLQTTSKQLICGGSIVSVNHVLTAAHCVNKKRRKVLKTSELLVLIGKHNLSAPHENFDWFHPYEILVHPDWETGGRQYDADIAVLVAEVPMPFSNSLLPVCLWTNLEEDEDSIGTVVGSVSKPGNEEFQHQVQVQRVQSARCYEDFHLIATIASSRTFCAGEVKENSGPCSGFSGLMYFGR